jgi:D-alanyl-D-alanine carboxypeptidase
VTDSQPARRTPRRIPGILVAGLLVIITSIAAACGYESLAASSSPTAASPTDVPIGEHRGAPGAPDGALVLRRDRRGALGEADGAVPDGVTAFEDEIPAVTNLDPDLLSALRRASSDAAGDGVEVVVNSGWRSAEFQERLFRQAVSRYGSVKEAARWVARADTSAHVSGDAVDIGPSAATTWLRKHGAEYGLCQIYRNEPWHYELRPIAMDDGCPPMYADSAQGEKP